MNHRPAPNIFQTAVLLCLLAAISPAFLAACAPNPSIIATLTLLPGTPTPRRPTPWPTITPRLPAGETAIPPAKCPPFTYETAAPEDPSQMVGLHYDIDRLPAAFSEPESAEFFGPQPEQRAYRWVRVRWQGRAVYWIDRQVCLDEDARPHWEVVDVLALPRLDAAMGEVETRACTAGDETSAGIIAYGFIDEQKELRIQAAYEIGPQFIPIDAAGVLCTPQE